MTDKELPLFVQPDPPKILIVTKSGEQVEIVLVCGEQRIVKKSAEFPQKSLSASSS